MLDYSYSFTRYARMTVGGRVAQLSPDDGVLGFSAEDDTRVWWGMSFTAGF
jgi:hypothetical protein